jgi:hypothetical protein
VRRARRGRSLTRRGVVRAGSSRCFVWGRRGPGAASRTSDCAEGDASRPSAFARRLLELAVVALPRGPELGLRGPRGARAPPRDDPVLCAKGGPSSGSRSLEAVGECSATAGPYAVFRRSGRLERGRRRPGPEARRRVGERPALLAEPAVRAAHHELAPMLWRTGRCYPERTMGKARSFRSSSGLPAFGRRARGGVEILSRRRAASTTSRALRASQEPDGSLRVNVLRCGGDARSRLTRASSSAFASSAHRRLRTSTTTRADL